MSQHVFSIRTNLVIFAILMVLLVVTVVASGLELGALEVPIALTIALVKAIVIMLYFMHLKFSSKLTWLFAGSGLLWLAILIAFTMADFKSRGWISPIVTEEPSLDSARAYFGGMPDPDSHLFPAGRETTGEDVGGHPPEGPDPAAH